MQTNLIKWVNPNTLVPNEVAQETFSETPTNYEFIKNSIEQSGIVEPLMVEGNKVISGNLRLKIALELGLENVPVQEVLHPVTDLHTTTFSHNQQRIKSPYDILLESRLVKNLYPVGQGCRTDLKNEKKKNKIAQEGLKVTKSKLAKLESIDKLAIALYGKDSKQYKEVWDNIKSGKGSIHGTFKSLSRISDLKTNEAFIGDHVEKHTETYQLFNKSCKDMSELADESIACIFTSPPYYHMRDYGTGKDQRGLEADIETFIKGVVSDMKDCLRVLKKDGSFWVNMGECIIDGEYHLIPAKLCIALKEKGWILNDEWIWKKRVPVFAAQKRSIRAHEYIFHFVKSHEYYYNESWLHSVTDPSNLVSFGEKNRKLLSAMEIDGNVVKTNGNRMEELRNNCKEKGFTLTHSAGYPVTIPLLGILSTSRPGDTVLDIYSGTGSTGEAAIRTGRNYVGYEIKPEYNLGAIVRMETAEQDIQQILHKAA